jgi:plasmid stability protein
MASLTLKNIPEPVLERLRERAASDRRSLTQEILFLLEEALARPAGRATLEERARSQARAWSALAGRWRSDREPAEEIDEILASRTGGRDLAL